MSAIPVILGISIRADALLFFMGSEKWTLEPSVVR